MQKALSYRYITMIQIDPANFVATHLQHQQATIHPLASE